MNSLGGSTCRGSESDDVEASIAVLDAGRCGADRRVVGTRRGAQLSAAVRRQGDRLQQLEVQQGRGAGLEGDARPLEERRALRDEYLLVEELGLPGGAGEGRR